jgi:RNA polymerase sigma-70 factor, ECF subfamily
MDGEVDQKSEPLADMSGSDPSSGSRDAVADEIDCDEMIRMVDRWRAGDEQAALELYERFCVSLVKTAGRMLPGWLQQRLGPEDVVQSVFRSFFDGLRQGELHIQRSGDLWVLLMAMTRKKLQKRVEFHLAGKRSPRSEVHLPEEAVASHAVGSHDEDAMELIAMRDELGFILDSLDSRGRRVLELRLQDFDHERIACEVGTSSRTVRRELDRIYHVLTDRLRAVS